MSHICERVSVCVCVRVCVCVLVQCAAGRNSSPPHHPTKVSHSSEDVRTTNCSKVYTSDGQDLFERSVLRPCGLFGVCVVCVSASMCQDVYFHVCVSVCVRVSVSVCVCVSMCVYLCVCTCAVMKWTIP